MFLHLSVILSTAGGSAPGQTPPSRPHWADAPWQPPPGTHPQAHTPLGRTPPPLPSETATAADGTYPTGMDSCCI